VELGAKAALVKRRQKDQLDFCGPSQAASGDSARSACPTASQGPPQEAGVYKSGMRPVDGPVFR